MATSIQLTWDMHTRPMELTLAVPWRVLMDGIDRMMEV